MFQAMWLTGILLLSSVVVVHAAIVTEVVEYKHQDVVLEGFLAYDDSSKEKRPGVLVVHEWKGVNDYTKKRAEALAQLGYVALAVDIYGKGIRPQTNEEAAKQATIYKQNRALLRERILAGLDQIKSLELTDTNNIAAIGYCFGGTTVLELARSGAGVKGVVSFHGGLSSPTPQDAQNIKAQVLVLHGGDDPYVPIEEVKAFEDEMEEGKVNWQLIQYPGAVHSFTNPEAGDDPSQGVAYNKEADQRSWEEMKLFFEKIFLLS